MKDLTENITENITENAFRWTTYPLHSQFSLARGSLDMVHLLVGDEVPWLELDGLSWQYDKDVRARRIYVFSLSAATAILGFELDHYEYAVIDVMHVLTNNDPTVEWMLATAKEDA